MAGERPFILAEATADLDNARDDHDGINNRRLEIPLRIIQRQ